jgi:serine/threonine-protein phosphatase 2A activator
MATTQPQTSMAAIPRLTPRHRQPPAENEVPVPATPTLPAPPSLTEHKYCIPRRRILSKEDHALFLASSSYDLILGFIFSLAEAVEDKSITSCRLADASPLVKKLVSILDQVEEAVQQNPPDHQSGSRFGNRMFIRFLDTVSAQIGEWHKDLGVPKAASDELSAYLTRAFGNRERIDYGSGHELNFMMWLLCLYQLSLLSKADFAPTVLLVFTRYILAMRAVQTTYYLEPAGSHGVWGLDDYHFLPFLFGASQLAHHPYVRPKSIHSAAVLEEMAPQNLYFNQIAFVNSVKTVDGLRWHSPMLDDISAARSWAKIEGGMRRMFVAEVLGKLPVMQHFLFGSLIPAAEGMSEEPVDEHEHIHAPNTWGDCCGIKVPSVAAAALEEGKANRALRRLPFD